MKVQIASTSNLEGIIIFDTLPSNSALATSGVLTAKFSINTKVSRLEFEAQDNNLTLTEIGATTLTPTVKTNVSGFEFSQDQNEIKVKGSGGTDVLTTSTRGKKVLIRVDFNTGTITTFE